MMRTRAISARSPSEQTHRRRLLIGVAMLIVLALTPLAGHHVGGLLSPLLEGKDHVGALCMIALHVLLAPIHGVFHVLLALGLAYGLFDRCVAAWRASRLFRSLSLRRVAPDSIFDRAAREGGLDSSVVRVVSFLPNPAFTAGLARPRVYVSASLATTLTFAQLVAVFAHEGAHVRRRDPLRLSAMRLLALTLFWLPAVRRLADDLADEAEIVADDAAAGGQPLVLASALIAMAGMSPALLAIGETGFHGSRSAALLERRVRRLAGERVDVMTRVTNRSLMIAAAALMIAWASGATMIHPMPPHDPIAGHCAHDGGPLSHLFCRRLADGRPYGVDCPHQPYQG